MLSQLAIFLSIFNSTKYWDIDIVLAILTTALINLNNHVCFWNGFCHCNTQECTWHYGARLERTSMLYWIVRAVNITYCSKVAARVKGWLKNASNQCPLPEQLEWEANIIKNVKFIHNKTRVHGNTSKDAIPASLDKPIPLLGPQFVPPPYLYYQKHQTVPKIEPILAHLKPLNVIHPFYYAEISSCPRCGSINTYWNGWNAKGSREVHRINREEAALGFQLRCKECWGDGQFCVATTNPVFWESWEHWKVPHNSQLIMLLLKNSPYMFQVVFPISSKDAPLPRTCLASSSSCVLPKRQQG